MIEKIEKFKLVPNLEAKSHIIDLKLSSVLFEDNKYYPWIFLVPRKPDVKNMLNLTMDERMQLMKEIAICENVMNSLFPNDQINVAMIGNMTPQLHVHIICRKKEDPDWPNTVWNNAKIPYETHEKHDTIIKIRNAIIEHTIGTDDIHH
ncbi:MAG: HIT family protein [Rickettsiales bacterium]|jgi:diadenosine tetraphosphate (Ap4A) HIT family hydrolase|nr:HIT family protein [Rickettsiales bacterium]